jgi:preprotein translocase subunit SecG
MLTFLIILHVLVCVALIVIVLLQGGKGAEVGAAFGGGGSQTVFGASGGASFMSKLTTSAAIVFMLTSLTLAYFYKIPGADSVMPQKMAAPAAQQQAVQPDEAPAVPDSTAQTPVEKPVAPEN